MKDIDNYTDEEGDPCFGMPNPIHKIQIKNMKQEKTPITYGLDRFNYIKFEKMIQSGEFREFKIESKSINKLDRLKFLIELLCDELEQYMH